MPFRLNEHRTKMQFITFAKMPSMVTKAAKSTGKVSNTQYIQHAICRQLAKDLNIPLQELLDDLPTPAGASAYFPKDPESPLNRFVSVKTGQE